MRTTIVALTAASLALAAPLEKRVPATNIDGVVLNYALTLEHLERSFYRDGLNKMNAQAFTDAGFEPWVRKRLTEIASHEATHVSFLTSALQAAGVTPVQECTYSFPYTGPASFLAISQVLEGVGVSAYLGAATSITEPDYLTAAGSILTVEARHSSWIRSAARKGDGFPAVLDTPLDFNQVYSLASPFITGCPSGNPSLPVKAFPKLTLATTGTIQEGQTVKFTYDGSSSSDFIVFYSGLTTKAVQYNSNGVQVPSGFTGQLYAIASSAATATDDTTKAGPAIVEVPISPAKNFSYM